MMAGFCQAMTTQSKTKQKERKQNIEKKNKRKTTSRNMENKHAQSTAVLYIDDYGRLSSALSVVLLIFPLSFMAGSAGNSFIMGCVK